MRSFSRCDGRVRPQVRAFDRSPLSWYSSGRMKEPYNRQKDFFVILGVIHGDRDGRALLDKWLESAGPDMVTLEFSHYGLNFRLARGGAIRQKAGEAIDELRAEGLRIEEDALDALFSYIDLPLEFTAASEYCDRRGAHLFLVDMDLFSSVSLNRMDELIAKENLRMLLKSDQCKRGRQKAMARLFLEKGIRTFPYTEEMRLRDRHMSERIGHLVKRHAPSRLVHICGWQHLCDPFGLYTTLYPKKAFIYDKAQGAWAS